jgi:hypothetical protein
MARMNVNFFQQVEAHIHPERLDAYRRDGVDDVTTLGRYLLNMALCESLYSPLQITEITLRNALHKSLSTKARSEFWMDRISLPYWQSEQIEAAKTRLHRQRKPLIPGRIVAELTFGFWVGFFTRPHMTSGLAYHIAKTSFAHAPKSERDIPDLSAKWQKVRDLRNRVFHHERTLHWQDLNDQHDNMLQLVGWMNPEMEEMARILDRFSQIRGDGLDPWLEKIQTHWPQS